MESISYAEQPCNRFVAALLSAAILQPSKGNDGDWDLVFETIEKHANGHQYFTGWKSDEGRTILHYASSRPSRKDSEETVKFIFSLCERHGIEPQQLIDFVNMKDNQNNTVLQLATENRNKGLVTLLIEKGANIYLLKTSRHIDAIKMIYDKVLVNIFDRSIMIKKDKEDETNESLWEIECDFGPVTGLHNLSSADLADKRSMINQTRHLARVLRRETATRSTILRHPLVQIFLHLKGNKFAKILYASMIYHEIVELYSCKEKWYYWKQLENLGQWGVNITILMVWLVALITSIANTGDEENYESFLQTNRFVWMNLLPAVYMAGMFASLLLVQGQLTKTKILGLYNEMFAKGFINILKFILAFLPLLVAFLITFHLLLPMKREFLPSWGLGFAKLLAMMTGEVGYDDVFYGEDEVEIEKEHILKILFIVFIVTVVILLQNLLIGMTVSDVQKLEKKAKVNNLASRLEDIYLLENAVTHSWIVKFFLRYNLGEWFQMHLMVNEVDTEVREEKTDGEVTIRKKRLDDYPVEIRDVIIQWDINHSESRNAARALYSQISTESIV